MSPLSLATIPYAPACHCPVAPAGVAGQFQADPSVYCHGGFNTSLSPMFGACGPWLELSCPAFEQQGWNRSMRGPERWEQAGAGPALDQLLGAWNLPERQRAFPDYSFSRFAWTMFHIPGGGNETEGGYVDCSDPANVACRQPLQCSSSERPAGYLIAASLSATNAFWAWQMDTWNEGVGSGVDRMEAISRDFGPNQSSDSTEDSEPKMIEAKLNQVYKRTEYLLTLSAARALQPIVAATLGNATTAAHAADRVGSIIAAGFKPERFKMPQLENPSDVVGVSRVAARQMQDRISNRLKAVLEHLVGAEAPDDQELMQQIFDSGKLLDYDRDQLRRRSATTGLDQDAETMFYSQLIPASWTLPPSHASPFLLRVDRTVAKCPDMPLDEEFARRFSTGAAQRAQWCDRNNNSFWLLDAAHDKGWTALPGGASEVLDGRAWAGLQYKHIIKQTWGHFIAHRGRNYRGERSSLSGRVTDDMVVRDTDSLPLQYGVNTPGLTDFAVCLDWKQVAGGGGEGKHPCPQQPRPRDGTEGWCRVHLTQWQRREGDLNRLNYYQIFAQIFDASGTMVGGARKQAAGVPLSIRNTKLPRPLIVAALGPQDHDPVKFWYDGEHWDSDTAGKCDVGPFRDGLRDMDCWWYCALPHDHEAEEHLPLLPVATEGEGAAPPKHTRVAKLSRDTFVSKWQDPITPQDLADAVRPYDHRRCNIHVRQWARRIPPPRDANLYSINPTDEFEVEVYAYSVPNDRPFVLVGSSGQVPVPRHRDTAVLVGFDEPLYIQSGDNSLDPLQFTYQGRHWSSHDRHCRTGFWDSNHRDLDCYFHCKKPTPA